MYDVKCPNYRMTSTLSQLDGAIERFTSQLSTTCTVVASPDQSKWSMSLTTQNKYYRIFEKGMLPLYATGSGIFGRSLTMNAEQRTSNCVQ